MKKLVAPLTTLIVTSRNAVPVPRHYKPFPSNFALLDVDPESAQLNFYATLKDGFTYQYGYSPVEAYPFTQLIDTYQHLLGVPPVEDTDSHGGYYFNANVRSRCISKVRV